jgi:hypothetical protein
MNQTNLTIRQIMNRIYKDICGFEIPKTDVQEIKKSQGSPIYGEINYKSLNKLLWYLQLEPHDIFFDLGSGVGKVILYTALTTPIKKAVGIELSETRHQDALLALKRASIWHPGIDHRCQFLNTDLMTVDLSPASIVYTCSTAFSLTFMKKITDKLSRFTHDFRLITLQDLPNDKNFSLIHTLKLDMSWVRKCPVYIYRRR